MTNLSPKDKKLLEKLNTFSVKKTSNYHARFYNVTIRRSGGYSWDGQPWYEYDIVCKRFRMRAGQDERVDCDNPELVAKLAFFPEVLP